MVFLSMKTFIEEVLLKLVEKTKKMYVLFALEVWLSTMTTFDFWMLVDANDIFAFVKFHLCRLTTQKHNYNKVVWSNQDKWCNFKLCLTNMDWGKNVYLNKKWRCKFGNHGCNLECYYELWKLGIGGTFPRHMFWSCHVKSMPIWYNKQQSFYGFHDIFI